MGGQTQNRMMDQCRRSWHMMPPWSDTGHMFMKIARIATLKLPDSSSNSVFTDGCFLRVKRIIFVVFYGGLLRRLVYDRTRRMDIQIQRKIRVVLCHSLIERLRGQSNAYLFSIVIFTCFLPGQAPGGKLSIRLFLQMKALSIVIASKLQFDANPVKTSSAAHSVWSSIGRGARWLL